MALGVGCAVCMSASAFQAPPAAYPLDSVLKAADHVFVGRLVSAKSAGDVITYEVSVTRNLWGKPPKSCMTAKSPYEIGSHYFFFVEERAGPCMEGGDVLRRGLLVRNFSSKAYVVLQDEKYLYPDFGDSVLRVDSTPLTSTKPITLWSGVPVERLEAHVRSLKAKRR